ncbi:MAG: hypothetical protein NC299_01715 [Lachnospiraceae bacterium]|nr:hypothetical protein [Ruminococcus sp.]MCM1274065.1 hypothetical protein [Lachnospiraceae bacterium]
MNMSEKHFESANSLLRELEEDKRAWERDVNKAIESGDSLCETLILSAIFGRDNITMKCIRKAERSERKKGNTKRADELKALLKEHKM